MMNSVISKISVIAFFLGLSSSYCQERAMTISQFKAGYVKVSDGEKAYYMNMQGEKAFDDLDPYSESHLGLSYEVEAYREELKNKELLPTKVIRFTSGGKWGVMAVDGTVLVRALYDAIEIENRYYWQLIQDGKRSFYLKGGRTLPFFEEIGYLDGHYFDVKQAGKWGIYSMDEERLIIPAQYEGFDYCGGCGTRAPYVYAKKEGKWGLIDWKGKELLPFQYDHEHWGMRSDNWVNSFSKNGKRLIVHIPTKREFVINEDDAYPQLISGLLLFKERKDDGTEKIGIYNEAGELLVQPSYDEISEPNANNFQGYYGDYLLVKNGGKVGVIDQLGKMIIPLEYENIMVYDDYFVAKSGHQTLLLDQKRAVLLKVEDGEISHVNDEFYSSGSDGLHIFKVKQKAFYGVYFADQQRYYPPSFYDVDIGSGNAGDTTDVIVGEKQGIRTLYDLQGNLLLPGRYQKYTFLKELPGKLLQIERGKKIGIYDAASQQEIIPVAYEDYLDIIGTQRKYFLLHKGDFERPEDELWDLTGDRLSAEALRGKEMIDSTHYLFRLEKGWALFNTEKGQLEPLNYAAVWPVRSARLVLVSNDEQTGKLFDIQEEKELPGEYDIQMFSADAAGTSTQPAHPILFPFQQGFAKIKDGQGYGFIREDGKELSAERYPMVSDFQENGLAVVMIGQITEAPATRIINSTGAETREGKAVMGSTEAFTSSGEVLWKVDWIDQTGKRLFEKEHYVSPDMPYEDFSELFIGNRILLMQQHPNTDELLYGLADRTGKVLLKPEYSHLSQILDNRYFLLEKGRRYGLADSTGKVLVPVKFTNLSWRQAAGTDLEKSWPFPIAVQEANKWFFMKEDGSRLPVQADYMIEN